MHLYIQSYKKHAGITQNCNTVIMVMKYIIVSFLLPMYGTFLCNICMFEDQLIYKSNYLYNYQQNSKIT